MADLRYTLNPLSARAGIPVPLPAEHSTRYRLTVCITETEPREIRLN